LAIDCKMHAGRSSKTARRLALEEVLQREGKDKEGLERAGQRERRERETERWREVEEGGPVPKGW